LRLTGREPGKDPGLTMKRTTPAGLPTAALLWIATFAAAAAVSASTPAAHHDTPDSTAHLTAFGGRSATQQRSGLGAKLDATLADLTRHLDRVRPGHELADLHSLNPAVRFTRANGTALVLVDAVTRADARTLERSLVALGLQHASAYKNDVSGWLPVSAIATAAAQTEVQSMRASIPRSRAALLATQGDFAQGTSALRAALPTLTGSGVTVGVLSDSFNCYAVYEQPGSGVPASGYNGYAPFGFATDNASFDESNGYLTASVNVVSEAQCMEYGQPLEPPFGDEGRAMLQVVHAVAPAAALAFYSATNGEADFANGITTLAGSGAKVIADDSGYFDEPFFQDGIVAEAIEAAAGTGVAYFSAAGNNSDNAYDNDAPQFATAGTAALAGDELLNFDTSGATTTTSLPLHLPVLAPGEFIGLILEWDQPYVTGAPGSPGASSSLDLCVTGAGGYTVFNLDGRAVTCTGANAHGTDPVQVLILGNPANASALTPATTVSVQIGLVNGSTVPGRIKLAVEDDGAGSSIASFATNSPTIQGHPGAAGAAAVAAAFFPLTPLCGSPSAVPESFSSLGGGPILFNTSGARLAIPQIRQKPDFTGPDGVNTSFFGAPLADYPSPDDSDPSSIGGCQNQVTYNNFFGTSAATPHAAGAAALLIQGLPGITPALVLGALRATAAPMGTTTPNFKSGYGFLQAQKLASPVVWFPGSTVSVGNTTTLSWIALNASSCTASGDWGGTRSTSGSQSVDPTAAGTATYTLQCTSGTATVSSSATLTAVPTLGITSTSLPAGQVGAAYSAALAVTGGVPPYSWSLSSGTLPAGLSFNTASGGISGTPTGAAGTTTLVFAVTDSEQPAFSKTATLTLTLTAAAPSSRASGGGGGGSIEPDLLAMLVVLRFARALRARRARGIAGLAN
jgi:Subtilase family/Putative Ig domain